MKKRNRALSITEQEQIKMYSLAHMSQKNIAATLGLCRPTIGKYQKRFLLAPHDMEPLAPEIAAKVLELAQRHGSPFISSELAVDIHKVEKVLHAANFTRQSGKWCRRDARAIRAALCASEKKIAARFGVSRLSVGRIRRAMWAGSGRKKNPANLQNETCEPDIFVRLLNHIFPEGLPTSDDSALVDATSKVMVDQFRKQITAAVHTLRRRQPDCRWTN